MSDVSTLALPLILVLSSAGLHATWNLIVKSEEDKLLSAWLTVATPALILAPALLVTGPPASEAWGLLLASGAIHSVYNIALARAYEHGDLSVVYPIARGLAPVVVAMAAPSLLAERLSSLALAAILLVGGGIAWLGLSARRAAARPATLGWAVATALSIAGYSLVDKVGVGRANPLAYIILLFASNAAIMAPYVFWGRGLRRLCGITPRRWGILVAGGLLSLTAYLLVLVAMRLTQVSYVAALRESSVIIAAILGWRVLREPFGLPRILAAVVVALGLVLLVVAMRG
jgi:drug/metabolite transporter (DMT)-like permease